MKMFSRIFLLIVGVVLIPGFVYAKVCSISKEVVCNSNSDCPTGQTCIAPMNDYCIVPPFIQEIAKPNLLMVLDNSASMIDLAYADKGKKHCSLSMASCSVNSDCGTTGGTCSVFDRQPFYCYDQTFSTANKYVGYFDPAKYYQYNFTTTLFTEVSSIPTSCALATGICKIRNDVVHLNINTTSTTATKYFYASGNFLNWLITSKFDVEKQVLTGGKYVSGVCSHDSNIACNANDDCGGNSCNALSSAFLEPESRGCVGQGYIKEVLTGDFVNYNAPETNNTNTSLGITFSVKGPGNPNNAVAPSLGGQTYINIYNGNYDQKKCQDAITVIGTTGSSQTDWRSSIETCLNYDASSGAASYCSADPSRTCTVSDPDCKVYAGGTAGVCTYTKTSTGEVTTNPPGGANNKACYDVNLDCPTVKNYTKVCAGAVARTLVTDFGSCVSPTQSPAVKTKVAYTETVQTCWSYVRNGTLGTGDVTRLTTGGKCSEVYKGMGVCSNNALRNCYANADCGAGTCNFTGPAAIIAGNPAIVCGTGYLGQFYEGSSPIWSETWGGSDKHCFNDALNSKGGNCPCTGPETCLEDSVIEYRQFCNDARAPNVTDPTDSASDTASYDNLPALISSLGVESQLGEPILAIPARVAVASPPSGLVQEYANKIRIGLMAFNSYGSASEVTSGLIAATKVCQNDQTKVCTQAVDCGTGACDIPTSNLDGAKILSLVGKGHCSTTTSTACTKKAHCPTGETCINGGVGSHTTPESLVSSIDQLRAATWTPFSEAFYNAIGYFALKTSDASGKTSRFIDFRLNPADYPDDMNPSEYVCQSNNILLVTDGSSTADQNGFKTGLVDVYKTASGNVTGNCPKYAGSQDLDDLSWIAKHRNINTFSKTTASTEPPMKRNQQINTYVVFNGSDNGETGDCNNTTLLTKTANNGGTALLKTELPEQYQATLRKAFEQVAGGTASGTAASILSNSEGSGANILQAVFYPNKEFETVSGTSTPTNASWIGEIQNLWYYVDPYIGKSSVREDTNSDRGLHVVDDFVTEFQFKGGETIAVLKKDLNGDGSGDEIITNGSDARVTSQGYCSTSFDLKCAADSGCPTDETCLIQGIVNADDVRSLWRAGRQLFERNVSSSPRKLYTHLFGSGATKPDGTTCGGTFSVNGLYDLSAIDWSTINTTDKCIITTLLQASSDAEAQNIIKFTQGYDHAIHGSTTGTFSGTIDGNIPRNRTVKVNNKIKTWKLGDIISSTPRIQSFNKLNNFHLDSPAGYGDTTYADNTTGTGFANSTDYTARGMAYAGANDGMLHAFKLGKLNIVGSGQSKATLTGTGLGEEEWAFIPKHVLPYLKYLADPAYSHLYLVDGPTRLIDASIGYSNNSYIAPGNLRDKYTAAGCDGTGGTNHTAYWACKRDSATSSNQSWRTVLVGSMGVGGATANIGAACSSTTDCVKAPLPDVGYSSYFALDITDPTNPKYLWEFTDPSLGAATSGVAVVRVNHKFSVTESGKTTTYMDTNGRWFAVIGNGPTGPIDTTYHQFKGKSSNPLKVFVLDLKHGAAKDGTNMKYELTPSTAINNAYVGSIASAPIDTDRAKRLSDGFYSDDALYFGYSACTANCTSETPTWNGGIMRLLTDESTNPNNWKLSTLISNIGPVSTAVSKLQDRKNKNLWLYTGSGRYFYKGDDSSNAGKIFAIKEPCYSAVNDDIYTTSAIDGQSPKCSDEITFASADFADQSNTINETGVSSKKGWFIDLAVADNVNNFGAERVITEPVAMPNGAVIFTSFMPSTDICNYGGKSFLWGMKYDTGGAASANQLAGKALVQVSTGSFVEVDIATALTDKDGRKMSTPMIGKPPTDPPPIVSASGNKALKRILHIQEK